MKPMPFKAAYKAACEFAKTIDGAASIFIAEIKGNEAVTHVYSYDPANSQYAWFKATPLQYFMTASIHN